MSVVNTYDDIVNGIITDLFKENAKLISDYVADVELEQSDIDELHERLFERLINSDLCGSLTGSRTLSTFNAWETIVDNIHDVIDIEYELGGFFTFDNKIDSLEDFYNKAEIVDVIVCEELARNKLFDMSLDDIKEAVKYDANTEYVRIIEDVAKRVRECERVADISDFENNDDYAHPVRAYAHRVGFQTNNPWQVNEFHNGTWVVAGSQPTVMEADRRRESNMEQDRFYYTDTENCIHVIHNILTDRMYVYVCDGLYYDVDDVLTHRHASDWRHLDVWEIKNINGME